MNKILWKSIREETKLITNYTENNYLVLIGKIISDKTFSHEIYGESFYVFNLEVPRLSGNEDIIPITISERLIANFDLTIGRKVVIEGQFRSYNSYQNERNKLILTVFAKDIVEVEAGDVVYAIDTKHYIENLGDEELVFLAVVINL